jgi:hypothetical protein
MTKLVQQRIKMSKMKHPLNQLKMSKMKHPLNQLLDLRLVLRAPTLRLVLQAPTLLISQQ